MFNSSRVLCFIHSSMRSGSTLLKALLAEANDISNIPEVNYSQYSPKFLTRFRLLSKSNKRIVVIKLPSSHKSYRSYPYYVDDKSLRIILFRDPVEVYVSLKKMYYHRNRQFYQEIDGPLFEKYWLGTYNNLISHFNKNVIFVSYENILERPKFVTLRLFSFLQSERKLGVDTYRIPENFTWSWGSDDGSKKINTLKVQNMSTKFICDDPEVNYIQKSQKLAKTLYQLKTLESKTCLPVV